jgi:NAD(P)-dependent dehydrogenase (short-subunit alcohol dehydrogenase family)
MTGTTRETARRRSMSVSGKTGIVTGAGSGLGEAAARRLAREGGKIIVADRNQDSVERVVSEVNGGQTQL